MQGKLEWGHQEQGALEQGEQGQGESERGESGAAAGGRLLDNTREAESGVGATGARLLGGKLLRGSILRGDRLLRWGVVLLLPAYSVYSSEIAAKASFRPEVGGAQFALAAAVVAASIAAIWLLSGSLLVSYALVQSTLLGLSCASYFKFRVQGVQLFPSDIKYAFAVIGVSGAGNYAISRQMLAAIAGSLALCAVLWRLGIGCAFKKRAVLAAICLIAALGLPVADIYSRQAAVEAAPDRALYAGGAPAESAPAGAAPAYGGPAGAPLTDEASPAYLGSAVAPAGALAGERALAEAAPGGATPGNSSPAGALPGEYAPAEALSADAPPAGGAPGNGMPAEGALGEDAFAGALPAAPAPAGTAPAGGVPGNGPPAGKPSAEGAFGNASPTEAAPAGGLPGNASPAVEAPASDDDGDGDNTFLMVFLDSCAMIYADAIVVPNMEAGGRYSEEYLVAGLDQILGADWRSGSPEGGIANSGGDAGGDGAGGGAGSGGGGSGGENNSNTGGANANSGGAGTGAAGIAGAADTADAASSCDGDSANSSGIGGAYASTGSASGADANGGSASSDAAGAGDCGSGNGGGGDGGAEDDSGSTEDAGAGASAAANSGGAGDGPQQPPDVVVILSESFWDPSALDGLSLSKEPLPSFKSLAAEGVSGNMISRAYGGGTADVEFEVQTGAIVRYLDATTIAYEALADRPPLTLASVFRGLGYATVAMHVYDGSFYGRDEVFPAMMGYDVFLSQEDMPAPEYSGEYIGDEYMAGQIISQLEGAPAGQPLFLFAISMENHQPYAPDRYERNSVAIRNEGVPAELKAAAESYLQGIHNTDLALKKLADYMRGRERPCALLFFGDHQPSIGPEFEIYQLSGQIPKPGGDEPLTADDLTAAQSRSVFAVPFLIWSNYKTETGRAENIGSNFLGNLLLNYIGAEKPLFFHFLDFVYDNCFHYDGRDTLFIDAQDRLYERRPQAYDEIAALYGLLEYDMLLGDGYVDARLRQTR
ncbi:MAG: sulfatase-like hydrolase/transferase [Clostridiales bacterium]|jgi:hypothetical protein|nr:sulfatase-like hydrolase/transferase [Clostridiales bacterium]